MQTDEPVETGEAEESPTDAAQQADAPAPAAETLAIESGPAFSGSPETLWLGFGVIAFIFVIVFVLLLRGRAARAERPRPAEGGRKGAPGESFFQPAGKDADITFDEDPRAPAPANDLRRHDNLRFGDKDAEIVIEREDIEPVGPYTDDQRDTGDSRPAPFAGLFARKERDAPAAEPVVEADVDYAADSEAEATAPVKDDEGDHEDWRREAAREFEEQRFEAQRRVEEREAALARAEEEDAARLESERRALAEREAAFERRKEEAALEQQRLALEEKERRLAARHESMDVEARAASRRLSDEIDARFVALSERFDEKLAERAVDPQMATPDDQAFERLTYELDARLAAFAERLDAAPAARGAQAGADANAFADIFSRRLEEQHAALTAAIDAVSARIDALAGAPMGAVSLRDDIAALKRALNERAGGPTAPMVQLSDIIRNALPPNAFELRAALPNNRRADCLVKLPFPPGPIAVDARFPVEAFNRLHAAGDGEQSAAETEFRRVALRHIVDVAERLIVPDETAESALLFLPSESLYAEMHARFPDIVQDSYRARVWIVSPTTLMATLHTMRAVMRDADARESADLIHSEAQHVLAEVDALRRRVVALEEDFNKAHHDVRDVLSSTDQVYRRAETIHNTHRALADTALDRGSRRIPAAEPAAEDLPPGGAIHVSDSEENDGPDLWEDDRSETDERPGFPLR